MVVGFVNDTIDKGVIDILVQNNIKLLAMRCAGYNNIDFKHAFKNSRRNGALLFAECGCRTRDGTTALPKQKNP